MDIDQRMDPNVGSTRVDVLFEPSGKSARVPAGVSIFDAASWNGVGIDSTCGGNGTCRRCGVQVQAGTMPVTAADARAFSHDQLDSGWRLACIAAARSDLTVRVPPLSTRPKAATVGVGRQVILRPTVVKRYLELGHPSLSDQRSDMERILDEIKDLTVAADPTLLRSLPGLLRRSNYLVTAVVASDLLIAVEPGDTSGAVYALAYDLGTTTVVATLLDLTTGMPVAVGSMLNKQQTFGADVISRISATQRDPNALGRLMELAHQTLQELAADVCAEADVDPQYVYEVALAGNATMTQLALGIDPASIGSSPFILATREYPELPACDLGLTLNPGARAFCFPALGAYVGGDVIAGALASGMDRDRRLRLFIDLGTNCEIILGDGDRLLSTAAPAGPAFEAGSIRCGMRATRGAVEVVTIEEDVSIRVIGDAAPVGLCGSGLIDVVAELVRLGLIDSSGRLAEPGSPKSRHKDLASRLRTIDGERSFVIAEGEGGILVYITQRDVRELQFAVGAISTAWNLLAEELHVDPLNIDQVLLAGSFGTFIDPRNAIRIGLVPELELNRIVSAGNVAGEGAKMSLLSGPERHGASALVREIGYIELSDRPDFNERFVDALAFPE